MTTLMIVLISLVAAYLGIGTLVAWLVTSSGGEKFRLDKNTTTFICLWPVMFFMNSR